MNILLTNDDGINCEGLIKFAEALRRGRSRILVVVPDSNRSGVSHSLSLSGPVRLVRHGEDTWLCSGTPADCVLAASLGGLPVKPDLVLSGINAGPNIGTDIIYSGTAAAARQAALQGIPAIAFSLAGMAEPLYWDPAVAFAVEKLDKLIGYWAEDVFLNVNLPNIPDIPGDMIITFPSRRHYFDDIVIFTAPNGHNYNFIKGGPIVTEPEAGSDWDAVSRNHVSVSPVFVHPVVRGDLCAGAPGHSAAKPRPKEVKV
ncbi:MAG: 5'/3'-nucleotidase SurE [Spirochaetaceae bacterium]|jgi:5'-nucleotidase|nr:5'/3'-nucleotidase SurE [Spirochaetaceae bacterium]